MRNFSLYYRFSFIAAIVFFASHTSLFASTVVNGYTLQMVEGYSVYVENTSISNHPQETQQALNLLSSKLKEINGMDMSSSAKETLRTTPIFVDWNIQSTLTSATVYHTNQSWLIQNGFEPKKVKSINILNIKNFLDWTLQNQPYMVLHEMSHALQDKIFETQDNQELQTAYSAAMQSNKYFSTYAATDAKEYFAELTEAYFGKNDFYPFTQTDLKSYDPVGYALIQKEWQGLKGPQPTISCLQAIPTMSNTSNEVKCLCFDGTIVWSNGGYTNQCTQNINVICWNGTTAANLSTCPQYKYCPGDSVSKQPLSYTCPLQTQTCWNGVIISMTQSCPVQTQICPNGQAVSIYQVCPQPIQLTCNYYQYWNGYSCVDVYSPYSPYPYQPIYDITIPYQPYFINPWNNPYTNWSIYNWNNNSNYDYNSTWN